MNTSTEFRVHGAPVSEGIAIGVLFHLNSGSEDLIPDFAIPEQGIFLEIERYRSALALAKEDLLFLQKSLEKEGSQNAANIIEAHIQMLEDPSITTQVEERICSLKKNAEAVFSGIVSEYEKKFSKIKDVFFQQRVIDLLDLSKRILGNLSHKTSFNFADIPKNSIVFAKELIPSHTAAIHASRVSAFITQSGGGNSHAALIARAKGIPYVSSIDMSLLEKAKGGYVIVDGQTGEIIFHPTEATLENYRERKTRLKTTYQLLQQDVHYHTETMDGYRVHTFANVGNLLDLEEMQNYRPEGIGLFRSEYLFLEKNTVFLSEEEQIQTYLQLVQKANRLPIVIRVFDIGGDKNPELFLEHEKETNPVLGCRGIRFLLRHLSIFRTQIRAIMRAGNGANVKILLPMVSDIHEVLEAKKIIQEVRQELIEQNLIGSQNFPIGCMVEVPSVVFICDAIAREVDFLSIGTNDLVQYTLGMDRSNPAMSDCLYPAHPSVIRMIKMVVVEAKRQNKPVTICGEIASNPLFVPLLLGLGIHNFSCSPRYIPLIKKAIRQCVLLEAFKLARRVLQMSSPLEISHALLEASRDPDLMCREMASLGLERE